jgi:hypothetical protein
MIAPEDLDAAVAEGIVTGDQASALREFVAKRDMERTAVLADEEHFRFMSGFNDFFLAIGVVLLGVSLGYFVSGLPAGGLVAAAVIWALAELLVARMRLVLPGILLAGFFVYFVFNGLPIESWFPGSTGFRPDAPQSMMEAIFGSPFARSTPFAVAIKALVAGAAALLFYARFRLPFALLPIAASIVLAIASIAVHITGANQALSFVLLACGLLVFTVAMRFDVSDPQRLTRRSDCAFWLHLLAAPLIVHSLFLLVAGSAAGLNNLIAAAVAAIVLALTLIAITIDRRALLVSTLAYLGSVIGYVITSTNVDRKEVLYYTLFVLGLMVVALGVGWLPLRRRLLTLLPPMLLQRLPPVPHRP